MLYVYDSFNEGKDKQQSPDFIGFLFQLVSPVPMASWLQQTGWGNEIPGG
jgi:hypothetical protein